MSALEFIRDVGKTFRISSMIHKETIAERLKTEEGMSFTEFSYSLL
jgi:tyrosyl-tRNA synthetase